MSKCHIVENLMPRLIYQIKRKYVKNLSIDMIDLTLAEQLLFVFVNNQDIAKRTDRFFFFLPFSKIFIQVQTFFPLSPSV